MNERVEHIIEHRLGAYKASAEKHGLTLSEVIALEQLHVSEDVLRQLVVLSFRR